MGTWTAWMILGVIGGLLLGLVVRYFLFRISWILANLDDPPRGMSILVVLVVLVLTGALGGAYTYLAFKLFSNAEAQWWTLIFYVGQVLWIVIAWFAAATIYSLLLAASYKKSLLVAGVEILLSALLIALVTALVMVGLAGWQISQRPPVQSELPPRPPAVVAAQPPAVPS